MGKLLVVGSLNMDMAISVSQIPQKGETVLAKEINYIPGGKGANQAYAMAKLGAEVAMIGCVGADRNGSKLLQSLQSVCVNTKGIQIFKNQPTGIAAIAVEETGENSIIVISGANAMLTKQWIKQQEKYIDECDIVIAQLETPIESICAVAELAKQKGKMMLLDPAPAVKDLPETLLQNISIIKPNETELQILTQKPTTTEQEIVEAANVLLKKGVEKVVVTLGEKGAILVTEKEHTVFASKKVKAVDTTAAGDAFNAAFCIRLAQGASVDEAARYGNAAGAMTAAAYGSLPSMPTKEALELFLVQSRSDL